MKFRCERDVLADGLATAARAVSSRAERPVYAGFLLTLEGDNLQITGSDRDLSITVDLMVAGEEDGRIVVPKLALDIVKALEKGAVTFETDGELARISGGRSDFSVNLMHSEDYVFSSTSAGESVTIKTSEFSEGVRQVVSAASTDETRSVVLTGVLMAAEGTGIRLVSTDSYRLAVRDLPGNAILEEGQSVLVPSRSLQEIVRVLGAAEELTLELGERRASFVVGNVRLNTNLLDGDFPNYRNLIPQSQPNRLTVGRLPLIDAVRRVKLMAREATPVRLTMRDGQVELSATMQDVGQAHESLDAVYNGTELTVAFNPDYLLTGLEVSPGDEVSLETVDSLKPALLRSTETTDFLYLLMPVRVS